VAADHPVGDQNPGPTRIPAGPAAGRIATLIFWGAALYPSSAAQYFAAVITADNCSGLVSIDLEIFDRLGLIFGFDLLA
jgi:hypothetical protein